MKHYKFSIQVKRVIMLTLIILPLFINKLEAKERSGEVNFTVNIEAPEDSTDVRLWLPYPVSDNEQTIEDVKIDGNFSYQGVYREKETGNLILYAEWTKPVTSERTLTFVFKASAIERVKKDFSGEKADIPVEVQEDLKGSMFLPTDGKVKDIAQSVTRWKWGVSSKARAVYDWVVENTFRDPNVKGCGLGDVEQMIVKKGGKCADISSIFVAVARAAGVPAREVFGLRLGKKDIDDITGGHHCWAEFYLPGYGWVPVDPADVRKKMLEEGLDLKQAQKYRDYYFGAVDEYRIALARGGRGYYLSPRQKDGPINYFMYPYAEVNGKALEWLAAQKDLKYHITFSSIKNHDAAANP